MVMVIFIASSKQKIIQFIYVIFYNQICIIGRTSYKVARICRSIRKWFGGAVARYSGIEKNHTQNLTEAMCYTFISKSWDNYVQFYKRQRERAKISQFKNEQTQCCLLQRS